MKKVILTSVVVLLLLSGSNKPNKEINIQKERKITKIISVKPKEVKSIDIEENLIIAMIQVESLGNDSAIGDKHLVGNEAVGALQIRPIMIREVNRILKITKSKKRYTKKDRFNREKSIEMFMVWKNYHHPEGGFETIARNWNGGPRGYKNKRTEYYWLKIQKELNNIN